MGDPRVLLGKGTSARGTSNYGLWASKSGESVTTDGDDDLIFNSTLADANITGTTIENKYGEVPGVYAKGYTTFTPTAQGSLWKSVAVWPKSDFTFNSTVYVPMCFAQIDTVAGGATAQYLGNTYYTSHQADRNRGCYSIVYSQDRDSDGDESSGGAYGALWDYASFSGAGTYTVYYIIMFPYASN